MLCTTEKECLLSPAINYGLDKIIIMQSRDRGEAVSLGQKSMHYVGLN